MGSMGLKVFNCCVLFDMSVNVYRNKRKGWKVFILRLDLRGYRFLSFILLVVNRSL